MAVAAVNEAQRRAARLELWNARIDDAMNRDVPRIAEALPLLAGTVGLFGPPPADGEEVSIDLRGDGSWLRCGCAKFAMFLFCGQISSLQQPFLSLAIF